MLCAGLSYAPIPRRRVSSNLWSSSTRQIELEDGGTMEIIPRTVHITDDWSIQVWEKYQPSVIIEHYWESQFGRSKALDPFGLVNWPGSVVATTELRRHRQDIANSTVLVVGAGVGVEAQALAQLGAKSVIATDYNPTTLKLLEYGVKAAGLDDVITARYFDLTGNKPLPECDIMVASDVMYSDQLAKVICLRCIELFQRNGKILVSDSQRLADFLPALQKTLGDESLSWEEHNLEAFSGSGVMIDEDQTYNVEARILRIGWTLKE
eukprot:CAMPEP_0194218606 /NCGR_PEP_ID=MMETSP0156-20130528/24138_1 /TAXON_ID=33649 /ORGANISM="Thalassionema nitzschioides, Strain L26-B" /LENGTH=265 /DNA_ID=CAMNT_0038948017 /DNA_START=73 /DNA_END=870 /DNA_ORIENTATION=-